MCDGDNLADVEQSERQYQEYLGAERMGEPPLRDMLKTVETRPLATRLIQIEISERYPKPV
jgi:hypothetical protein